MAHQRPTPGKRTDLTCSETEQVVPSKATLSQARVIVKWAPDLGRGGGGGGGGGGGHGTMLAMLIIQNRKINIRPKTDSPKSEDQFSPGRKAISRRGEISFSLVRGGGGGGGHC